MIAIELGGGGMASARWWLLLLLALNVSAAAVQTQEINWQEAVARLARERTLAETCAVVLRKYGDQEAKDRGSLAYGEAKAEYDGVIGGLVVALARKGQPESLPDLQARLQHGFAAGRRRAFGRWPVVAWSGDLSARPRTLAVGRDTVMGLIPLSGGDVLVALQDPMLARLRTDGTAVWTKEPPTAYFRDDANDVDLAVSSDDLGYDSRL
jgi:hypothetical protein